MHKRLCVFLLTIAANVCHAASEIIVAPDGLQHCVVCHGVELVGNRSVDAPNLSVLSSWYVEQQIAGYRRGLRAPHGSRSDLVGLEMQPMAAALKDREITAFLAFLERVPRRSAAPTVGGNARRGADLYASCAACHGLKGEGNAALNAPRLAGQSDWYLVRQLANYAAGARGAAGGDTWGAQMRAATLTLNDAGAIGDVVGYINTLTQ